MKEQKAPMPLPNFPKGRLKFYAGQLVKVVKKRSGHSAPIGAIVQITTTYMEGMHTYPYVAIDTKSSKSFGGFFEDELEECVVIKAYAYKKDNEFHWFSTEKPRKGYERFPTHDIEKYV